VFIDPGGLVYNENRLTRGIAKIFLDISLPWFLFFLELRQSQILPKPNIKWLLRDYWMYLIQERNNEVLATLHKERNIKAPA
jgi:hypothetical protein